MSQEKIHKLFRLWRFALLTNQQEVTAMKVLNFTHLG
jgi:hypothetical protein